MRRRGSSLSGWTIFYSEFARENACFANALAACGESCHLLAAPNYALLLASFELAKALRGVCRKSD
jgi:hypothetical protein